VRPEAGPLVRKAAIAVGLGAINPALAVFALYEPARGEDQPCGQLIAEAKRKGAGRAKDGPQDPERSARVAEQQAPGASGEVVAAKKKGG